MPSALVTGGVHGYETSGVHGALQFAEQHAADYAGRANLVVAPCVSPWAYERIHRWNPLALDPEPLVPRGQPGAGIGGADAVVAPLRGRVLVHVDLHETTDTDETEFRPALAARDGVAYEPGEIPDGFYLCRRCGEPAAGVPAGGDRGGREGHAHRAGRRERARSSARRSSRRA